MRSYVKGLLGFARTGALVGAAAGLFALVALPLHKAQASRPAAVTGVEENEEEGQDSPDKALEWRRLSWRNPDGTIPKDGLRKALAQRNANMLTQAKMKLPPAGGTWTSVGSNNVGGRTNWISIDKQDTKKIFTATAGGGIWKSTDSGTTWGPVNDRFPSLGMGSVLIDPNNSSVVYGGFGESTFNGDALEAGGLYKSTDGGANFSLIPSTANFKDIGEIAVQPGNSNVILLGTRAGIMRTTDGGTTWTSFQTSKAFYNVTFNPSNPNNAIASYLDLTNFSTNGAYYTLDGGATWAASTGTQVNDFYGRSVYGFTPAAPTVVYAVQGVSNGTANVFKSTDSGANFSLVRNVNVGSTQHWYDNALWVDPTNANNLAMGALDIWRSTDGGANWTKITYWVNNISDPNLPHADVHHLISDPGYNGTTNRRVYVGCDGGVFVSDDILNATTTSGWRGLNAGYVTTQPYGGAANATTGRVIAGLQDNGTLLTTLTSPTSTPVFGGDGGWVAIDPGNPQNIYGEYVYARVHRSLNNGATSASYIYSGITDTSGSANFISPFILSPSNTKTMWVGALNLWRTFDATAPTPAWTSLFSSGSYISAITEAPSNANVLYVGDNNGKINKSTNATAVSPTFSALSGFPTGRYVGRIAVSNTDPNKVYVGFGTFFSDNVYRSLDGGSTWSNSSGSGATALPSSPIHGLAVDPLNSDHVFAGTEVGLYESTDGGVTWSTSAAGPNNACVDEVNYVQGTTDKVLIATHGRGSWVYTPQAANPKVTALSNPATLVGGNTLAITVTLSGAAPSGYTVNLTSDNAAAIPATSFAFPAGSSSATFALPTKGVDSSTLVQITASAGGGSANSRVTLSRARLASVRLSPSTVVGGSPTYCTINLDGAVGTGYRAVSMTSDNASATVPATVYLAPQTSSVTFTVNTTAVTSVQTATLSATSETITRQGILTVRLKPQVTSVVLSATNMVGGNRIYLAVYLDTPAPAGGMNIALSSTLASANIPTSLYVVGGSNSGLTYFTPNAVDSAATGSVTATSTPSSVTQNFSVVPANLTSLSFSPASVNGGTSSVGTLRFDGTTGPSGRVVTLASSSAGVTVPVTVTVPSGRTVFQFVANTNGVSVDTNATVTATSTQTQTGSLQVKAGVLTALNGGSSVTGGSSISLTVVLSAKAGPGGTVVNLSSNTGRAVPPATVTIPAGATSATFAVSTTAGAATTATITAQISGGTALNKTIAIN